jgi:hypothetical protein
VGFQVLIIELLDSSGVDFQAFAVQFRIVTRLPRRFTLLLGFLVTRLCCLALLGVLFALCLRRLAFGHSLLTLFLTVSIGWSWDVDGLTGIVLIIRKPAGAPEALHIKILTATWSLGDHCTAVDPEVTVRALVQPEEAGAIVPLTAFRSTVAGPEHGVVGVARGPGADPAAVVFVVMSIPADDSPIQIRGITYRHKFVPGPCPMAGVRMGETGL